MDGIDVALVRTDGKSRVEFGPTMAVEYPADFRRCIEAGLQQVTSISKRHQRPENTAKLEQELTDRHAAAVTIFLATHALKAENIDLLGFHGQTVLHRPDDGLTVQLGDGAFLAKATGIDVIYDFRAADMTAGGQGAPLVPVFHQAISKASTLKEPVCFVNIGGISNITYVDGDDLIAFDSGPGNALIDQWVQTKGGIPFDQGGRIASEGGVLPSVVEQYLSVPYFEKPGPKSLDRGNFEPLDPALAELSDGARTLAHVTAAAIYRSVEHLPKPPANWVLCGGGRLNQAIVADLTQFTSPGGAKVILSEEAGFEGDMLEAQAFGYLAIRSQLGLSLTYPTTTGCSKASSGGVLALAASNAPSD